jgi:glucose/arabinose dehydrogenase
MGKTMSYQLRFGIANLLLCVAAMQMPGQAASKWTYANCDDVTDANFKLDTLVRNGIAPDPDLQEPDKLAFNMNADGTVDVYYTEIRPGNIKRYNAKTKTVTTLVSLPNWGKGSYLTIPNNGNIEEGVTGIALDPNFKTNGWLYVHWSPLPANKPVYRISRFTVANNKIELNTEKIILEIPAQRDECCHTGGSLEFDAYGDLWIAQGANGGRGTGRPDGTPPGGMDEVKKYASEEWGSSDTHGLRGGFLRIHPDNSDKGYTIPEGNFGEYFFKQTNDAKYMDVNKVAPEVYIKGTRNNYSMSLDPVRRWVLWGDVGPDVMSAEVREEYNLRKSPGFEGWPYFVGNNTVYSGGKNPAAPTNTSKWNTGLTTLPPARPTFPLPADFRKTLLGKSPIGGPLYLYDGDSKSGVNFPPHFNRKWFVTDWNLGNIYVFDVDAEGNQVTGYQRILANKKIFGPVDFKQGPDGALYLSCYGLTLFGTSEQTSIQKITYTGTCHPALPKLEAPTGLARTRFDMAARRSGYMINMNAAGLVKVPAGMTGIELYGIDGKLIWSQLHLKSGDEFRVPSILGTGALKYRWVTASR